MNRVRVQRWECCCGDSFSGPVEKADRWMAAHLNGHGGAGFSVCGSMMTLRVVPLLADDR